MWEKDFCIDHCACVQCAHGITSHVLVYYVSGASACLVELRTIHMHYIINYGVLTLSSTYCQLVDCDH